MVGNTKRDLPEPSKIDLYVPFYFSPTIDPRRVFSVGDQVICEHLFAYHSRRDIRTGFVPAYSEIEVDRDGNQLRIKPLYPLFRSTGESLGLDRICDSLKSSLSGTQHAPYAGLLKSVTCDGGTIRANYTKIPVNLPMLFTIPDYSIFEPETLPITDQSLPPTTGPYFPVAFTKTRIDLRRNTHFPSNLVANTVDEVSIHSYPSGDTEKFIETISPITHPLVYFFGHSISEPDELKQKGYRVEIFPSEWFLYVSARPTVSPASKRKLAALVDANRESWLSENTTVGIPTYSISPSGRPFALTQEEWRNSAILNSIPEARDNDEPHLRVGTYRSAYQNPVFKTIADRVLAEFPNSKLVLFEKGQNIYGSEEIDISVSIIGMDAGDPLTHLAFLGEVFPAFDKVVPKTRITELAQESDPTRFVEMAREIERDIARENVVIPIAHFPGIVASAPNLERDPNLAWNWGIQAWTYRVR